jgi:hypothetical protein
MAVFLASIVSLVLAALSLGPSYAHVLEALPRLTVWPAELWRDATVFHRQFEWYALIGAPVDIAAIIAASRWRCWSAIESRCSGRPLPARPVWPPG